MKKFNPQDHWVGMPEFVQEKKTEYAKIIIRFDDEESLQEFSSLIGQKLTSKTKSIWHPYKPHCGDTTSKYIGVLFDEE